MALEDMLTTAYDKFKQSQNLLTGVLNVFDSSQMEYFSRYLFCMLSMGSLLTSHLYFSLKVESIVSMILMFSLHLVVEPVVSAFIFV